MNSETKTCQNCKSQFIIEPDDFLFYEKINVPPPTWCPECRARRRFVYRNERTLWRTECAATKKQIFSMFPPDRFTVYSHEYWWSDQWDAISHGRDYDFSRPFFEQFGELMRAVPWFNRSTINLVNSEYCNHALDLKNCYLVFDSVGCENIAYSVGTQYSKDSFDLTACTYCERSAHSFYCHNSYEIFYSSCCEQCTNVWFSKDCIGCSHCFGCVGLHNKSYYLFNKPYSKEEYFKKLKELKLDSYTGLEDIKKQARETWLTFPVKFMHGRKNKNVSGDYIYNSKNVKNSFWVKEGENLRYVQSCSYSPNNDSYDMCVAGVGSGLCYEGAGVGIKTSEVKFACFTLSDCYRLTYVMNCHNSSDCFGCIGLRNKKYCIFNKQYTKEEYKSLVPRIIEHMNSMPYRDTKGRIYTFGEFYPPDIGFFAYNETVAQEYLPLLKEEALLQGFTWRDSEEKTHHTTLHAKELPDRTSEVEKGILEATIRCLHEEQCNDPCYGVFRLLPQELTFYQTMKLSLPRLCSNCRHAERLQERNIMKFWNRKCACSGLKSENGIFMNISEHFHGKIHCPNEFETSYAPDRPEIVYCEACYQQEAQ